jgi:hypothetical protein
MLSIDEARVAWRSLSSPCRHTCGVADDGDQEIGAMVDDAVMVGRTPREPLRTEGSTRTLDPSGCYR